MGPVVLSFNQMIALVFGPPRCFASPMIAASLELFKGQGSF